jgi:hypothetical protein
MIQVMLLQAQRILAVAVAVALEQAVSVLR